MCMLQCDAMPDPAEIGCSCKSFVLNLMIQWPPVGAQYTVQPCVPGLQVLLCHVSQHGEETWSDSDAFLLMYPVVASLTAAAL